jgi:hypothetical protein
MRFLPVLVSAGLITAGIGVMTAHAMMERGGCHLAARYDSSTSGSGNVYAVFVLRNDGDRTTKAQASERIDALQQQTGRGAERASLRRREAPYGHAEHHETSDHDHARLEERGRCQPNPQKLIRTRLSRR